ncbi:hypothetical protein AAFF_G00015500 [Aldrovandia affinis]|uniref:Uncharacterized protein n=1 Tax=Aldrovandia affinis TaxID=143900 RepID=A0AAD7S6N1_9TELE|nr:hypothetical protein AAFF_G00015500 [Aldrovandia affinis]
MRSQIDVVTGGSGARSCSQCPSHPAPSVSPHYFYPTHTVNHHHMAKYVTSRRIVGGPQRGAPYACRAGERAGERNAGLINSGARREEAREALEEPGTQALQKVSRRGNSLEGRLSEELGQCIPRGHADWTRSLEKQLCASLRWTAVACLCIRLPIQPVSVSGVKPDRTGASSSSLHALVS